MPLHILLILVIGGIAGIALALHLLGKTGGPPLTPDSARAGWLREFPYDTPTRIVITTDGRAARIETATGRGLVWQMGADTSARMLRGAQARIRRGGLMLHLPDAAAPRIKLTLTPDEQRDWTNWIKQ